MRTLLVAGATGDLGRHVVSEAKNRGLYVRAIGRDLPKLKARCPQADEHVTADALDPGTLAGVLDGVDVVFSALGASVSPSPKHGRRSFGQVDTPGNLNLITRAREASVSKFVYVSTFGHEILPDLEFVRAHEDVVRALRRQDMPYVVLRPTGFFSSFGEVLRMAKRGPIPEIGRGDKLTNPITDEDLAELAVDAVQRDESGTSDHEIEAGGPEVFSRRQIAETLFQVLNRPPDIRNVSPTVVSAAARAGQWINPRLAAVASFGVALYQHNLIAPRLGRRRLADYLRDQAMLLGTEPAIRAA